MLSEFFTSVDAQGYQKYPYIHKIKIMLSPSVLICVPLSL